MVRADQHALLRDPPLVRVVDGEHALHRLVVELGEAVREAARAALRPRVRGRRATRTRAAVGRAATARAAIRAGRATRGGSSTATGAPRPGRRGACASSVHARRLIVRPARLRLAAHVGEAARLAGLGRPAAPERCAQGWARRMQAGCAWQQCTGMHPKLAGLRL